MLARLRSWFAPPQFADENATHAAYLLNTLLWALTGGALLYGLFAPIRVEAISLRVSYISALLGLIAGLHWLMRRGQVRPAAWALVGGLWAVLAMAVINAGVNSPAFNGFIVVILAAGLMLGPRAGAGIGLVSAVVNGGVVYAFQHDWLTAPAGGSSPTTLWVAQTVFFAVSVVLLTLALRSINRALQQARTELAERQRAEAHWREAELKYRTLVEQVPAITYIDEATKKGETRYISPQVTRLLGISPEAWKAGQFQLWQSLLHPADRQRAGAEFYHLIQTGEPQDMEYRLNTPRGEIWIHDQAVLLRDEAGQPTSVHGVMFDITERKRAEEALRRSEERFRMVLDNLGEGVMVQNNEWRYTYANPAAHAILGWPPGTLLGAHENDITPLTGQVVVQDQNALRQTGRISTYEVEVVRPSGELRTIITTGVPRLDEPGQLIETFVAFTDITERKQAEVRLHDTVNLLTSVMNATPDLIFVKDRALRTILCNEVFARALGKTPAETYGRTDVENGWDPRLVYGDPALGIRGFQHDDVDALNGLPIHNPHDPANVGGEVRIFDTHKLPLRDVNGNLIGLLGVARDVTDRDRAEEEIRHLNATLEERVQDRTGELETVNAELEAFSYSIAHDLRAPLRALDGYSRMILEDYTPGLDAQAIYYLNQIQLSAHHMGLLIDDLLRFSRLGRQALRLQPVSREAGRDMVEQVFAEVRRLESAERHIELHLSDLPACEADFALLKQVWVNVLGNALKYTRGCALARIEVGYAVTTYGRAWFVRDNGVGFDMQYANKLFKVFQRLHAAEDFEGTGVGLAIVQRIVQKHGGRIWAEAEPQAGATFYFTLGPEESEQ